MLRATFHSGLLLLAVTGIAVGQTTRPSATSPADAMKRPLVRPVISGSAMLAFEQFRKLVGVRMSVDLTGLAAAGVKESDKVEVRLDRATGEQVLDVMLARLSKKSRPLAWYIDGDMVRVTTQAEVLRRRLAESPHVRMRARARPTRVRPAPSTIRQVAFDETPLEDVIDYLRRLSGVNMHVNWGSLELIGVDRDTSITLRVSGVSLRQVLDLVTDQLGPRLDKMNRVYWVVDGGVVTIATGAALNQKMRTRVYNVTDILAIVPSFEAPEWDLSQQGQTTGTGTGTSDRGRFGEGDTSSDEGDEEDLATQRQNAKDTLIGIIRDAIGEDMWLPVGKGSVRIFGNNLVISQTLLGFKLLEEAARPG